MRHRRLEFDIDEMGEFLEALEELNLEPEELEDGSLAVYGVISNMLVASFSITPEYGEMAGWIDFSNSHTPLNSK